MDDDSFVSWPLPVPSKHQHSISAPLFTNGATAHSGNEFPGDAVFTISTGAPWFGDNGGATRVASQIHKRARRSSWALIATITVLSDMRTAPTAGDSRIPWLASTPAASGMAITLYPAAHQRFWIILR